MKQSYTNFDDLLNDVSDGIERIVRDDVAPQLEERLLASAKKNIHPQLGISGITDAKNIVSNVSRDGNVISLIVKDIAKPEASYITSSMDWSEANRGVDKRNGLVDDPTAVNVLFNEAEDEAVGGTMFANWIEHGLWMDWAEWIRQGRPKGNNKPKRPKREFISPVQVEAAMIVKTALHGL